METFLFLKGIRVKTKELIEKVNNAYLLIDGDSEKSWEVKDEIVEKLRQLEDIKRMLREMWELLSERDEVQWDLTQILEDKE